ncbi:hypothetical protein [Candidatus Albibeggiatoa sp. nov. NOAA]|uniref:hypothetical protein n=1 Tax=Candidatus Albibeggiatoa sp. nov. NOAA TaxID=3162724 RepID=UPI0032F71414|nr:DUF1775 domain-containing protein [Thiotrichaceae bacterium]
MQMYHKALVAAGLLSCSLTVFGHAGYKPKDINDNYDGRRYAEGSTAYLSITVPHGCKGANGERYTTNHVGVVLPSMVALPAEQAITKDRNGNQYGANAIMGIKVAIDNNWAVVRGLRGDVSEFYSHGIRTNDIYAIHWLGGELPDNMYAELKFRATLPTLTGCVTKMRVYTPAIQYCGERQMVWNAEATAEFPEESISSGYTPYFDVMRNVDNNPLDDSCIEEIELEVTPPADQIDWYLSPREIY